MAASINDTPATVRARRAKSAGIPLSAGMILVTLGVVYGDIGTSPMYTLKAIMSGNGGLATMSTDVVLGALLALVLDALFNRAAERSEQPQIWHA